MSGTVKFEGKPVSSGNITFAPLGGGVPEVANIVSGMYEADITVGKKKVEIRAFRPGKAPPKDMAGPGGEGANIVENYIPSKYNDESTEAREVTASGPNTLDFDLKK